MAATTHPSGLRSAPAAADLFTGITAGLAEGRQLEGLLGQFLNPIVRLAGAQGGLVRVLSDDGEHMRMVGDVGLPADVRAAELSVDRHCGTCGLAADGDAPAWTADMGSCARHARDGAYFGEHCKRMLAVPLRHRGRLLGLYNLFFESEAELGADILAVLRSVGELLGLALHNARLERENLCATVMTERKFLASEVHDSIAQNLVYVNMRLPMLQDAIERHDEALAARYVNDVEMAMGSIQGDLREILTNFRTPMDPQGLLHAVSGMAGEFARRSGIPLQVECAESDLGLTAEQEVQVFHIVQEALANVNRHAGARHAWLRVAREPSELVICVEDDGRGIGVATSPSGEAHFGLGIMCERAERIGARVEIVPRAPVGTRVCLRVPASDAPSGVA